MKSSVCSLPTMTTARPRCSAKKCNEDLGWAVVSDGSGSQSTAALHAHVWHVTRVTRPVFINIWSVSGCCRVWSWPGDTNLGLCSAPTRDTWHGRYLFPHFPRHNIYSWWNGPARDGTSAPGCSGWGACIQTSALHRQACDVSLKEWEHDPEAACRVQSHGAAWFCVNSLPWTLLALVARIQDMGGGPWQLELRTKVIKDYPKFYNHKEGPYWDLCLVESAYKHSHIEDTNMTLC